MHIESKRRVCIKRQLKLKDKNNKYEKLFLQPSCNRLFHQQTSKSTLKSKVSLVTM